MPNPTEDKNKSWLSRNWDKKDNITTSNQGNFSGHESTGVNDFGESKFDDAEAYTPDLLRNKSYVEGRAMNQDNWDKAGNAVVRFAGRAATSAAELVGNVYGLGKFAIDLQTDPLRKVEYFSKHGTLEDYKEATWTTIFDNEITRGLDQADSWIKSKVPQYASKDYQNAPWYKKWQYANFYADDLADAAGFAFGSMVGSAVATKLTGNLFKLAKAGQLNKIDDISNGLKSGAINELQAAKEIDKIALKIKAVDYTDELTQMMVAGTAESGQEARSTKDATFKKIIDGITKNPLTGVKYREATESEIRLAGMMAEDASEASFLGNLLVTGPASKLMLDSVFKGTKNLKKGGQALDVDSKFKIKADYDVSKSTYKPKVDNKYVSAIKAVAKTTQNNSIEMLQEMYQTGLSAGVEDFYLSKYYGKSDLDAMLKATNVALNKAVSDEGLLSGLLGFLTPGVSNTLTRAATGQNPLGNLSSYSDEVKKNIAYTALLNKSNSQSVLKNLYEGAARQQHFQNQLDNAIENGNDFDIKNQMHNQIENLILTRIQTGTTQDLFKDVQYFKSLSKEDFNEVFGLNLDNEKRNNVIDFVQNKLNKLEELNKNWDSIETTFPNLSNSNKVRLWHANNAAKDSKERSSTLHKEITELVQNNYKYTSPGDYISNPLTILNVDYSKLSSEEKDSYKQTLQSSSINPIDKIEINKKLIDIDNLNKRAVSYTNIFNELLIPETQEALNTVDSEIEETSNESELTESIENEQLAEEGQSIDPFADAILNEDINKFAERIKSGEKLTSPEDLEFYQNNKEKVEARLKELGNQLNAKDDTKLESSYPENEEEIYPRVYESNAAVNPLRTGALKDIVLQPKEVSELIEKLRSKGKDINDTIKLRAVDFNGKKSIQILSGDSILGFFNDEKYSKEAFKQIASQIPVGTTLDNKKVKQLGFGIKVSGGIIATSNEATTIGDLAIDKKSTGDQYVIYDQGTKTEGTFTSEPQLITLSIDPSEHKLPEYTKMFGRYVLATKDSSGNWKHIPIYPTKLKNLTSKLQDKYFNDLKAELDRLKGVKEIDTDALYEFNAEVNKDVFISLSKEEVKKSGVDGIEVTLDINSKGNLRVNIVYITRTGGETKTTRKKLVIKDNAIGNNLDTLIEAINSQNPGFVLTKDSFKKSIPTGTMYQVKGDEFEAYIEPQVFKGQKVTMTVDNAAMALNTVEETKVDNIEADKKADIERRRQEELLVPISLIKLPQYLAETIKKAVERLSVTQRYDIVKAAINGKTAQQIVSELNLIDENGRRDTEIVRQVRAYYGIPSLDAEDYKDWKISIDKINAKYDAELAALESPQQSNEESKKAETEKRKQEGTNLRGTTYKGETTEKDGLKVTKYSEFRSDGKRISKGGRIMTPEEFIEEYNITDQDYLDSLEGATEIRIYEVREGKDTTGISIQGTFPEGNIEMEVAGTELAALETPTSTRSGKADIERRRQEELKGNDIIIEDRGDSDYSLIETKGSVISFEERNSLIGKKVNFIVKNPNNNKLINNYRGTIIKHESAGITGDLRIELELDNGQVFSIDRNGNFYTQAHVRFTEKIPSIVTEINAKYDAELKALESNVKTTPNTTKADIEKRRHLAIAELDWNHPRDFRDKPGHPYKSMLSNINAIYDAEYVDAVKKGEMTKEQAMQALEEIGRKDSSAYAEIAALEGTKSKPKSIIQQAKENAKKDPKGPELDNTLFKTGAEVVDNLITNKEIDDLKNIIPQGIEVQTKKDLTTFFDNILKDKTVWGYFKDKVIYLSTGAGLGSGYHEAFHAIFRYGMNNEEVRRYLALAAKDLNSKYTKSQIESKLADLRVIYGDVSNINKLLLEEHLADEFMKYKNNKLVQVGLKSLFRRFVNMLKALVGISSQLDSLFGQIERGDFAARVATKNDISSDLVFKNVPSGETSFLTQSKSKKLINTYATRVAKISKSWDGKSKKLSNEQILDSLLSERKDVLETLAVDYIENVTDNIKKERLKKSLEDEYYSLDNNVAKNLLKKEVLKKLELFNIVEEEDENDGSNDTTERFGNKDAWMLSMEETLPKQIRQYIAFATYKTIDELTGEEVDMSVDAETIYNGLSHVLANTAEDDILNKWIAYAKDNDQAKAVLDMVMSDTGMSYDDNGAITDPTKNFNDLRKIITAFKRVKVQFQHTEFNPIYDFTSKSLTSNKVDTYNANRNTPEKIQMNNWANNLQNISSKERPSKEEWNTRAKEAVASLTKNINNEITNDIIKDIKTKVSKLGINLSNGFIRYSLIALKEKVGNASAEELEYNSNFDVEPLDIDIFTSTEYGLSKLLSEGKDVFGKVEGIRGRLETIAKANSMFDESIATSNFKGADGNTRYDIILPSYALDEALRLKSKSYREYLIQKYPVLTNNIFINNDKIMNDFKIGIVAGLRDHTKTDNEGKVFGDYSEREYLSQYLGYWFGQKNKKAQFLFRQNEASNTAYTAELPIVEYFTDKISDKAIDTVFEFFKGEYNRIGIETAKGLGNIKGYNDTDKGRAFRFTEFSNLLYSMTPTEYNQLTADAKNGNELTDDQIGRIKYILKTNLAKGMSDFKNLLEENKFGKFKGGILSSNFLIPTNFGSDNSEITHQLNNLYLNDYINSFGVNQLLDGDYALSRDDKGGVEVEIDGVKVIVPKQPIQIDITKRNKGAMGSGPDMGKGTHRVAYTKDINAYVEDEPVNGNLVRVPDDSKIYKDSDGSSYILKGDVKVKVSKVNSSDAQSYNTINHVIFMAARLGRLDETVKTILRKVRRGIPINGGEQKTLQNAQVSLNPWKTVTFGREFYIKTSEALLDRHEVSIVTNQDRFNELMDELESLEDSNTLDIDKLITINKQLVELYEAIPGKEYYHKILNQMDIHGIDQVVAESASKGATLSPVDTMLDEFDLSVSMQDIPNGYKRLQVETPTGKTEITSGTQLMQLIDSEQNDEIKIGKTSVGKLRKKYRELMASSRSNSFRLAEQLIREKDGNIDITRLSDKFLKSLEASGADDQLLEIFSKNWNLLPAIDKAEQLFLAHFGNGVLSQKVPGTKVALMSDAHFRLVVDENDKPVLNKTVKSNPSKYKQYKTRKLLHNVKDPVTGEIYSECVLSERVFSKFGLKIGDAIPTELATMLGYRIPTQDKHSMISLRVVDVLPIHLEGTGIFPQEIVYLSGADFDIDSLFIQQPSFWMNDGVPTKYGTEKTIEDKWTAYLNYILANKDIQLSVSKKRQFGPDLTKEEFDELTPEAKEFLYDTYNRQTLKEFGLPSTMKEYEKYLKSGKKIINNEINNDILDIELKLLTNSHMLEKIAYTPVSSDPLVKVAKKIMELKGQSDSDRNSVHDILGKFKAFSQNSAGKSGIGIIANALQAFTLLARNNINRDGTLIKINGTEFNNFTYTNSKGNRTADLLSTILSVMTDNAKDPIAGKMGLSLELLPTYTYLVSLGVSEESAALLINIPIIQKYSNLKKENKFGIKSSYEKGMTNDGKIVKLLIDELGIEKTKADTYSIFKLKDASSNIEFDDLTNEGLIKDGITKDNTEVQLQLLGKFLKIEEEAESFRDLNNVIKLTKGLATNFNDLDKNLVESLYRLGIDGLFKTPYKEIDKTAPFNITNAVKEDSLLFSNIVMALNSIKKADGIFITESPLFKVQFEKLLNNLKDKLSKDTLADAKRSFLGFLTTKAYNKLLTDNRTAAGMKNAKVTMNDELLFPELGGKTLAAELIELKNSKNENISENTFIKWLAPSLKSNNPKQVIDLVSGKSFIKLSKDTINDILDGYKELFNNAETNEFAIKAFNYLLVKDNLEYKNDSFVKYIAPYMFNTVSDSLNLAVSQLAKKEDIEKVFGADMISLGDEFREIYSAYKPNQYKSVVVKKGDKLGMKTFADLNNKAMLISDNGSTITFNSEADATADPDRKSENMTYLTDNFDSKKDKDSKQVTFKFPEFMVIKVGKEERLYKTDVSGMVKWDTYAEYKQVEQFGYPNVSPYPKSLKDSRATQAKLGSLIRTNEEEEYSEDGELTNPMDVFSTSTKDKVVGVEEVFGNILSSSDSDAFDNGPDNFDLVFGEINTGNKLQESEKNSILGKDFGVVKAELNRKIISSNFSDSQMKEYLTDLNNSKTIEDLEKLIEKIC